MQTLDYLDGKDGCSTVVLTLSVWEFSPHNPVFLTAFQSEIGWVGLGWVGVGWVGLGGLGWLGLGWLGLGWVAACWPVATSPQVFALRLPLAGGNVNSHWAH